jgi:hypothetical protein
VHGKIKLELSAPQQRHILALLAQMGMFDGLNPATNTCDDLLVAGAKFEAMVAQANMIMERRRADNDHKLDIRRITGLYGQRPRTDELDGTVEQIYTHLPRQVQQHWWVRSELFRQEASDADQLWRGPFATEFELGILALIIAANGEIHVERPQRCADYQVFDSVPAREFSHAQLWLPGGIDILAVNAPAVDRPKGEPRPTGESTMRHWLDHYGPLNAQGNLVVATTRVHGRRLLGDMEPLVHQAYPQLTVHGLSMDAEPPEKFLNHALIEAVWLLVKANDEYQRQLA